MCLAELARAGGERRFRRAAISARREAEIAAMLHAVGAATLDDLRGKTVPGSIRCNAALDLPPPIDEAAAIAELRALAAQNALEEIADRHGLSRHASRRR